VSQVIAILGMHRSGTSGLTGLLQEVGVFLGAVATKNVWNLKGNRENPRIMALHEELLGLNGGSWDAPPTSVAWPQRSRLARDAIIESYQHVPLWGFKDPRTLVVLEGWLEALPNLQLVGIFRHPLLVAESLQRRDGFPLEKGLRLWHIYNEILLAYHGRYGFPILSFDSDAFTDSVLRLARSLGLPASSNTAPEFFDPRLRHRTPTVELPLPRESQQLYLALTKLAG
jgi:hypothetical protein